MNKVDVQPPPPMIYFNIGWMTAYQGKSGEKRTVGNHTYLKQHLFGAESFNFLEVGGQVRGYRPGHRQGIRIERLGAANGDDSVSGVLAIWMAREPVSGRTLVVGWYHNATIYRQSQYRPRGGRSINGEQVRFSATAAAGDARLLPLTARQFQVPSNHQLDGGFGQSPLWYGTEAVNRRLLRFIDEIESGARNTARKSPPSKPPRNSDPERRREVEDAAIRHACDFYRSVEGGDCSVDSVERDRVGWDLEVRHPDGSMLLVEVKGLQGSKLICELTPNEYEKMQAEAHRDQYVIYVVCNALIQPTASVFRHIGNGKWETMDGRVLNIAERRAAVLTC